MIEVRDLVYEYPTARALFGVSFSIRPQTITALVGPNGAGKTTLLRCLAALDRPYAGQVLIDGIDTAEDPRAVHAKLGYLADFYGLYDALTVRQSLFYAARSRGIAAGAAGAAVMAAAGRVGLADRLDATAATLSRGLRQRLAIGQALVHQPRVLLLDEPAAGLDPEARRSLSALLVGLKNAGMTIIVSSHILAELSDYSTAMLVMDRGRIVQNAPIEVGTAAGTVRMRIVLSEDRTDLGAILARQPGVSDVQATAHEATFAMADNPAAQALLLRALIAAGLSVAAFAPAPKSLEDAYFEQIHARSPQGPGA